MAEVSLTRRGARAVLPSGNEVVVHGSGRDTVALRYARNDFVDQSRADLTVSREWYLKNARPA